MPVEEGDILIFPSMHYIEDLEIKHQKEKINNFF